MTREKQIKKEILEKVEEYYKVKFPAKIFIPGETKIDPSGKVFDENELKAGVESILDGWWTEGRFTRDFEKKFSDLFGIKSTMLTNSGSSANLLAFQCLTSKKIKNRILPGDEIITAAVNFPTTVTPIIQSGCVPVFLDIENINSGQYNIDTSKIKDAITEKTKAIFLAHTLGNPFNIKEILEIKEKNNLWLIEDCCDALGSTYQNQKVGTFGDLATFSFYPAHHITMGEGGAIITNSKQLEKIIRSLRSWGRDCWCEPGVDDSCGKRFGMKRGELPFGYDHKNTYSHSGYNLKVTDMQAAIGLKQLDKLNETERKRKENFRALYEGLAKYKDKLILPEHLPESNPSWFGFLITVKDNAGFTKREFEDYLTNKKVLTRALFCGNITKQPFFEKEDYRVVGNLENADYVMNNTFWIGVHPNITPEKREYMVRTIENFIESR
jgi:CDP-6-deoxy-D-xylo-4-hexulose-3-dehydrase